MSGAPSKGDILLAYGRAFGDYREAVEATFPDRRVLATWDEGFDPAAAHGVAYALAWKPEPGLLAQLPDLEVIFSLGAGVDHVLSDTALPDLPLVRFVDPDLTGRMVEWIVLQCLMHLRRVPEHMRAQAARRWADLPTPPAREVTVGIMGLGELGRASAKALRALGFPVRGWSRSEKRIEGVGTYTDLAAFLAGTDILVSLLPLTDETRGLLDARVIEALRPDGPLGGPVLVNGGRGGSQNEADIAAALRDGRLRGASLDVFEAEPLAEDSPLWGLENAVLTPHDAAVSSEGALADYVRGQVERYERGDALENVVDRARGY